jgi:signal recognition particle GTPase
MVNPNRFYTYAYLREDRTPYYIGKGKNDRVYVKRKNGTNPPKDKTRIIFLKQNLTEEEAFKHEIYMIAVLGRKDLGEGILHNRTDGGDGNSNPSEEMRKKMSQIRKGKISWNKGKKLTEEHKKKLSESHFGKKMSEEHRKKISNSNLGKKHTEDTKNKLREMFIGHSISIETRQKISQTLKGNKNASGNQNVSGTKWWNNGQINKRSVECPGEKWVLGMLTKKK